MNQVVCFFVACAILIGGTRAQTNIGICGDGIVSGIVQSTGLTETCDTGSGVDNPTVTLTPTTPPNGCTYYCQIQSGWTCSGSPSVCTGCGDGIVNATAGEQCDDNNIMSGDGCSCACKTENALIYATSVTTPNNASTTPVSGAISQVTGAPNSGYATSLTTTWSPQVCLKQYYGQKNVNSTCLSQQFVANFASAYKITAVIVNLCHRYWFNNYAMNSNSQNYIALSVWNGGSYTLISNVTMAATTNPANFYNAYPRTPMVCSPSTIMVACSNIPAFSSSQILLQFFNVGTMNVVPFVIDSIGIMGY